MNITADHYLDTATRNPIPGGATQNIRRLLVIHFTAGASGLSSIDAMKEAGTSVHLLIERDGLVRQCRPFNRTAGHAGGAGKSRWRDPDSHEFFDGVNTCGSIGIELANAGADPGALAWAKRNVPGFKTIEARHRNGGPVQTWEAFYDPQLGALGEVTGLLMARYRLDDITGHDCVAPERRDDPGPAFPMLEFRREFGMRGLPDVFRL